LTVASFLLIFGRLGDMFGGYPVYVAGLVWLMIWSLIAGFSTNEIMLNFCRALQGLGPAAFLPSSVMVLGSIYRPGPRKNLIFSIYGASAPLGFFMYACPLQFSHALAQEVLLCLNILRVIGYPELSVGTCCELRRIQKPAPSACLASFARPIS
jgi:MFS family permease